MVVIPLIVIGSSDNHQIIPQFSSLVFGLYDILSRIVWSICMSYIIFACIQNSGGPINRLLSHPFWQPISKLSYAIYLVHKLVLGIVMASMKSPNSFSEMQFIQNCISIFVLSAIAAILLVLAVELPAGAMQSLSTIPKKQKTSPNSS